MEELTMLVQLAGGEIDAVRRLRQGGLRTAKDLAERSVEDVSAVGGLPAAVARRLVRAAQDQLESGRVAGGAPPTRGLGAILASGTAAAGAPRSASNEPAAFKVGARAPSDSPAREPLAQAVPAAPGHGVTAAESQALAGRPGHDKPAPSFWKFG